MRSFEFEVTEQRLSDVDPTMLRRGGTRGSFIVLV